MKLIYSGIALAMLLTVGTCNQNQISPDGEPNKYINSQLYSFIK